MLECAWERVCEVIVCASMWDSIRGKVCETECMNWYVSEGMYECMCECIVCVRERENVAV